MEESVKMTVDRDKWRKYVYGVANPRIDGVLAGAPRTVTDKLQRVLNVAARVITGTR